MSQLALTLTAPTPTVPLATGEYACPCCGGTVVDEHVDGDALCCWCRDIDDPRLGSRVRELRVAAVGPRRCCLARMRANGKRL